MISTLVLFCMLQAAGTGLIAIKPIDVCRECTRFGSRLVCNIEVREAVYYLPSETRNNNRAPDGG